MNFSKKLFLTKMLALKNEDTWRLIAFDFKVIWQINLLVMFDIYIAPTNGRLYEIPSVLRRLVRTVAQELRVEILH